MDLVVADGHLCNMGRMIEEMEGKLRNSLDQVRKLFYPIPACVMWDCQLIFISCMTNRPVVALGILIFHSLRDVRLDLFGLFTNYRFILGRRRRWFVLFDPLLKLYWGCQPADQMTFNWKICTINLGTVCDFTFSMLLVWPWKLHVKN